MADEVTIIIQIMVNKGQFDKFANLQAFQGPKGRDCTISLLYRVI